MQKAGNLLFVLELMQQIGPFKLISCSHLTRG
jgi:hypothetical protein